MKPEQIPYGVKDFKLIRREGLYYVDKSSFIERLEQRAKFLFFVRPRRFGKSLLCEMLRCYYDVAEKENFERLFGGLYAGAHPTANASRYFVLLLDFSKVNGCTGAKWEEKFYTYVNGQLDEFIDAHRAQLRDEPRILGLCGKPGASEKYDALVAAGKRLGYGMYVIVDEYDNFTNDVVSTLGKAPYKEITHGTGFYRGWFKAFKATADRIFMTGVSPVTFHDDSFCDPPGFVDITEEKNFSDMLDFSSTPMYEEFAFEGNARPLLQGVAAMCEIAYRYSNEAYWGVSWFDVRDTVRSALSKLRGYRPLGYSDIALFPDRTIPFGGVPEQSYVIELKQANAGATEEVLAKNHADALSQLKKYAADPALPALAGGTPIHFLCYEFKGRDLHYLEEIDPATGKVKSE